MTCVLGIDPGKSGGIAAIWDTATPGVLMAHAEKIPETERDILDMIQRYGGADLALIEKVASSPQMGVVSAFTFGRGLGALRMALVAAKIPFEAVAPGVWQKRLGCLTKGDKNVSKRRAQELYPTLRITHATADALLIATYGLWTLRERTGA